MSEAPLTEILSPKSPTLASAVFGSSPRPRRPSTPRSPSGSVSQPHTPSRSEKSLPPVPVPAQSRSPRSTRNPPPRGARPDKRPDSPDVETMIQRTPRPRRKSSATFHSPMARARSNSSMVTPSSWKGVTKDDDTGSVISDYGALLDKDDSMDEKLLEGDGSESDSSIDIHTPLPHLMFRDGLLSPRSKLLPGGGSATLSLYINDDDRVASVNRANSVLSVASTVGSTVTKSGIHRDPRDTQRRRVRHRDQTLLRAGMGLTTGLGWSDSEDEDAPSLLTRRLINSNIDRQPSVYSTSMSRAPSQLAKSTSAGNLSRAPSSYTPAPLTAKALSRSMSGTGFQNRLSIADTDSVTSVDLPKPATRSRTQSNASASSIVSSGSRDSSAQTQSVTSSQSSQIRTGGPRPLRLPQTAGIQNSVTRSTSMSESRPPVSPANAKITNSSSIARARTRTLSNPGSRQGNASVPTRSTVSRMVPPRSVSTSVMAPVRSISASVFSPTERSGVASNDQLLDFPLPPRLSSSQSAGLPRPNGKTGTQKPTSTTSTVSAPGGSRPQVGLRPPRTGTGMAYRTSSYSSFYETSRTSRLSSGKEVGVI
ncbi:hypothetical protein BD309DRAFT_178796 [Dichomitus squalens]|uniref:Uncharacterized protein n=1 Tax=Dichomitus squalens TaxID=114155 RepID=A0A4Q9NM43_9APHY|nr:hypothetical protein BD309DRAFT_178796 [Dichomitus squalens]TBU58935.1 hypothetical protein BD310DRAFT_1038846 [Dichomitus squalens]